MLRSSFFLSAITIASIFALPSGHSVKQGGAKVVSQGEQVVITSGKSAVIHWDQFSVDKGESAKFQMQDSKSSVLNRVTGGNKSEILGRMESNGNVYLLNPKGILFGKDSQINVNSLVASTLDVLDENFLREGELHFFGDEKGSIVNMGNIEGHNVFLFANDIENHGTIQAEGVGLATGSRILLRPEGEQRIFIEASNSEETIDNRGKITALTTEIKSASPYVLAVRTSGTIDATTTQMRDGKVFLVAENGTAEIDGEINATHIEASGKLVMLSPNASVQAPEGNVFIGGDPQNLTTGMVVANQVQVQEGALIDVSSKDCGDGGNIYLFAKDLTTHEGVIDARGGPNGGNGGFVELSCIENQPGFTGRIDRRAPKGEAGTLFIDPKNFVVGAGVALPSSTITFNYPTSAATLTVTGASLGSALDFGSVIIQCNNDCQFSQSVTTTAANDLTIRAGERCLVDAGIAITMAGGTFSITINDSGATVGPQDGNFPVFFMDTGSSIVLGGGTLTQTLGNFTGTTEGIVNLNGATITGGSGGVISLTGVNDVTPAVADNNYGISLTSSSAITTTGVGTITLAGTGAGGAGNSNHGINLQNSTVSVATGLLTISGTGIATGATNRGVSTFSTTITSTDLAGSPAGMSITGNGGPGTNSNHGIEFGPSSAISTGAGPMLINGNGNASATGNQNFGINNSFATISSTTGSVTLIGQGGGGFNQNRGINLLGGITSDQGNIVITGTGGGTGVAFSSQGVALLGGSASITSTGTSKATAATITINGTGGVGNASTDGFVTNSGSLISTIAGDLLINGDAAGVVGAGITTGTTTISSTGTGANAALLTFVGNSPPTGTGTSGLLFASMTTVSTVDGNISITGTGLSGTSEGVGVQDAIVQSTGAGTIDITGVGFGNAEGVSVDQSTGRVTSSEGAITIMGTGGGSSSGLVIATGGIVDGTSSAPVTLTGIGGPSGGRGVIVTGTNSKAATDSALLTITGTGAGASLTEYGVWIDTEAVVETVTGNLIMQGNGGDGTSSNIGIFVSGSASITSVDGNLDLTGNGGDGTAFGNDGISFSNGSIETTGLGAITLTGNSGGGASITNQNDGVSLLNGATVTNSGTGTITIIGTALSTSGSTDNNGILISDIGTAVTSSSDINMTGIGAGVGSDNHGISILLDGSVTANAAGELNFTGTGGDGTLDCHGVYIAGAGVSISSGTGDSTIMGTGGNGSTNSCNGIFIDAASYLSAAGTVTFNGTGGGVNSEGILLESGASVTVQGGSLAMTGQGVGTGLDTSGIEITSSLISSTISAPITLIGTASVNASNEAFGVVVQNAGGMVSSNAGKITIVGTGAGTTMFNHGVAVAISGIVEGTSSAEVEVQGIGGVGASDCSGIFVWSPGRIYTDTGSLTLIGTGGTGDSPTSYGVLLNGGNVGAPSEVFTSSGTLTVLGQEGGTDNRGILLTADGFIENITGPTFITTMSDLDIELGSGIAGGSGLQTVSVARDINITGSAVPGVSTQSGIFPGTGGVTISTGRDVNLFGTSSGSAHIGNVSLQGLTSAITFTSVGQDVNLDAVSTGVASNAGVAVIGHAFEGGSGNITFSDVVGDVTVLGANAAAGAFGGYALIGHGGSGTQNGDINITARGSISVIGGTAGTSADAQIGHLGGTTTSSNMTLIAGDNLTMTSQVGAGTAIISNPSTSASDSLQLVVDNSNPTFPLFGPATFSINSGSFLTMPNSSGEVRIYTVQPSQNTVGTTINGAVFVPTPLDVDDNNNQYSVYFPGGTFVGGALFRVYYKIGTVAPNPAETILEFEESSFYKLAVALSELQDRLPIFRFMRMPQGSGATWHHPSFCGGKGLCDPGFDPYHSLNFRDNVYWVGDSSSEVQ